MKPLQNLIFDLDGTLTDPATGIVRSVQYALGKVGRPVPREEDLLWCIGPPLRDNFSKLLDSTDAALVEQAVVYYRERFGAVGYAENRVYAGVNEALALLRDLGKRLFVASSKPTHYARLILEHFALLDFFDGVYGSELDGRRSDKEELLGFVLDREAIPPQASLMVGDRRHDVLGAKRNGLIAGGVLYGYGSAEELRAAGADYLFATPREIIDFVVRKDG